MVWAAAVALRVTSVFIYSSHKIEKVAKEVSLDKEEVWISSHEAVQFRKLRKEMDPAKNSEQVSMG